MRLLKTSIISSVFLITAATSVFAGVWEQVPLRTQAQVDANPPDFGGEGMQHVIDIDYSPNFSTNNQIVYMLSDTSRVWKSSNAGASWSPAAAEGFYSNAGVSMSVVRESEILSEGDFDKDVLFVAGSRMWGEGLIPSTLGTSKNGKDGIYRSENNGRSWSLVRRAAFFGAVAEVKVDNKFFWGAGGERFAVANQIIYAGTGTEGILRSSDGGYTWVNVNGIWNMSGIDLSDYEIVDIKILPNKKMLIVAWQWDVQGSEEVDQYGVPIPGTAIGPWSRKVNGNNPELKMFQVDLAVTDSQPVLQPVITNNATAFFPRSVELNPCDLSHGSVYVALGNHGIGKLELSSSSGNTLTLLNGNSPSTKLPDAATNGTNAAIAALSVSAVSENCIDDPLSEDPLNKIPGKMYVSFYRLFGTNMIPYSSTDGGNSWASSSVPTNTLAALGLPRHGSMNRGAVIAQTPLSSDALVAGCVVLKSTTDGKWAYSSTGYTGGRVNNYANGFSFQGANNFSMFLTDWGVITNNSGAYASPLCPGGNLPYSDFCMNDSDHAFPGGEALSGDIKGDSIVIAYDDKLIYSEDRGVPASYKAKDYPATHNADDGILMVKFSSITSDTFYLDKYKGVISNGEITFTDMPGYSAGSNLRPIFGVSKISGNEYLYASSTDVNGKLQLHFMKSGASTWTPIGGASPPSSDAYDRLVVSADGARIYMANITVPTVSERGISRCNVAPTVDEEGVVTGMTCSWSFSAPPSDGFNKVSSNALAINPYNTDEVCVGNNSTRGHSNGVLCTHGAPNFGDAKWIKVGSSSEVIPNSSIYALGANPYNGDLYAGTSYGTWVIKNYFRRTKNDFNNDGIAGWIWKGEGAGVETLSENWQLTYPLYSYNWGVPNRFYTSPFSNQIDWDISTTGDFNADGHTDILWRNKTTAEWRIWHIIDGVRAGHTDFNADAVHEWTVIGAGDTDKDGDDDIIFEHTGSITENIPATYAVMVVDVEDHDVSYFHSLGTMPGYRINRIGDFDKDGDVDLLFRQVDGDLLTAREVEAHGFVTDHTLNQTGVGYNPACAADFDGDGDDDIMFLGPDNQVKWFDINNFTRTQHFSSTNSGFEFLGCGDYDGDGDADTVWRRTVPADDAIRVVLQQGWEAITRQVVYTNAYGGANGYVFRANQN